MTTFGDLVTQVKGLLSSYTGVQEQLTWLSSGCTDTATTLSVADSQAVSVGISELEEELIWVTASENNSLTLAPFGRGFRGSTAAAHNADAMLVSDPVFPTLEIKRAINQTLSAVYPDLYRVKEFTFTYAGSQATWELPADCDRVLNVMWELSGPSLSWIPLTRWSFEANSEVANGKAINLVEPPEQNRTVKVTYMANFTQFASNSDTFATVGFPESALDVLLYGATSKLVRFLEMARLQTGSVENISRSQLVAAGDASKLANQLYASYKSRLQEERLKLLNNNPPQIHFTR